MEYNKVRMDSRLSADYGAYKHQLHESLGVGDYVMNVPRIGCEANGVRRNVFYTSPYVRLDKQGVAACRDKMIDVDSELLGLTRRATKCPGEQFIPKPDEFCKKDSLIDSSELHTEDARISNPPCTLRGTGWNRWEWLCQDPQERAVEPFQRVVSNRLLIKDNHRPCIPTPVDPALSLPTGKDMESTWTCEGKTPPYYGPTWRQVGEVRNY
jgi:hypothetical protein